MSLNVVKRLTNQNRVNCLFDVISQSDNYVKLFTEQSIICSGYRGLKAQELCESRGERPGLPSLVIRFLWT